MIVIGLEIRQRFCVVECENLKVPYYREHEMRGIKRPQLRVVPKEDLWDILENAHNELSHARRDRMHNQLWINVLHYVQYSKNIDSFYSIMLSPCLFIASQVSRLILAVFSALLQYLSDSQKYCANVVSYTSTHAIQLRCQIGNSSRQ